MMIPVNAVSFSFVPDNGTFQVGKRENISIVMDNDQRIDGIDVIINTHLLTIISVTPMGNFSIEAYHSIGNPTRLMQLSGLGYQTNYSGVIYNITIEPAGEGTGILEFQFINGSTIDSNVAMNGTDILYSVENGFYLIKGSGQGDFILLLAIVVVGIVVMLSIMRRKR